MHETCTINTKSYVMHHLQFIEAILYINFSKLDEAESQNGIQNMINWLFCKHPNSNATGNKKLRRWEDYKQLHIVTNSWLTHKIYANFIELHLLRKRHPSPVSNIIAIKWHINTSVMWDNRVWHLAAIARTTILVPCHVVSLWKLLGHDSI